MKTSQLTVCMLAATLSVAMSFAAAPVNNHNAKNAINHSTLENGSAIPVDNKNNDSYLDESHDSKIANTKIADDKSPSVSDKHLSHLNHHFDKMMQNYDNPKPSTKWLKSLGIGGLINVDLNHQTNPDFSHKRSDNLRLSAAKINIEGRANQWITGHVGFFAADDSAHYYAKVRRHVALDEAYVAIKNLKRTPFYLVAGRHYLPFGRYHRYPILKSLTQQLSEIRHTAIQLGFVDPSGLYGAVYTFNGLTKTNNDHERSFNNYGASLGYDYVEGPVEIDLGANYLNNLADIGNVMETIDHHYYQRVAGFNVHADFLSGPFSLNIQFITALQNFDKRDVAYRKHQNIHGAKPSATNINIGYAFKTMDHDSKLDLGYQWSNEAYEASDAYKMYHTSGMPLQLPKSRFMISYGINILKNTIVVLEYDRDHDYEHTYGGTDHFNNIATLRLTVLL